MAATADPSGVDRVAYSPSELAAALGTSRTWVYMRMEDGTIPNVRLGSRRFIPRSVVEKLLATLDGEPS